MSARAADRAQVQCRPGCGARQHRRSLTASACQACAAALHSRLLLRKGTTGLGAPGAPRARLHGELHAVARVLGVRVALLEEARVEHAVHVVLHLLQRVPKVGLDAQRGLRHAPQLALHAAHLHLRRRPLFSGGRPRLLSSAARVGLPGTGLHWPHATPDRVLMLQARPDMLVHRQRPAARLADEDALLLRLRVAAVGGLGVGRGRAAAAAAARLRRQVRDHIQASPEPLAAPREALPPVRPPRGERDAAQRRAARPARPRAVRVPLPQPAEPPLRVPACVALQPLRAALRLAERGAGAPPPIVQNSARPGGQVVVFHCRCTCPPDKSP